MTPETLCDTNEMQEIIELSEKLIAYGATLEDIIIELLLKGRKGESNEKSS